MMEEDLLEIQKNRKRRINPDPSQWKDNTQKQLRLEGREYTYVNKEGEEKKKAERILGPHCGCSRSGDNCVRQCHKITEEDRLKVKGSFDKLSWDEKKMFVISHVNEDKGCHFRRYHLYHCEEKIVVCRKLFCDTICIPSKTINNWVTNSSLGIPKPRKVQTRREKPTTDSVITYINSLPKQESHYCRARTSKVFLHESYKSKYDVYKAYLQHCKSSNLPYASLNVFYTTLKNLNISVFIPRKDQCEFCYSYETGQVSKEKYEEHIQKKKNARSEMQKSYESSEEKGCFSMDVQATKTCPKSQLSSTFYKTKLQCHNFTIYNNKTRDCSSFWFTEIDSDSQASTYISFIFFFLIQCCVNLYKVIELFSDNCASQNKNIFLANALLYLAVKFNIVILQKFLTRGHTQMKVDSSHACIERKLDKEKIDVPQDYVDITSQARKDPKPYDVTKVDHTFFRDFRVKERQFYKSLKPNAQKKVTDVVAIKYSPEGKMFTKTKFTSEWEAVPGPRLPVRTDFEYPPLHRKPLPISARKYRDLQDLKSTVDSKHHKFYDSLPHN